MRARSRRARGGVPTSRQKIRCRIHLRSGSVRGTLVDVTKQKKTSPSTSTTGVTTLLILGASGDLTGRLLLPGLGRLLASGRGKGLKLEGAGSDDWSNEKWRSRVKKSFDDGTDSPGVRVQKRLDAMAGETHYHQVDVTKKGELSRLVQSLDGPVALYFALPPAVSQKACEVLSAEDLPAGTRLVLEKPFGSDEKSARKLNATLASLVDEDHIHRVDHFLGKGTVLNILGLRFSNRLFEPIWNSSHIAKVELFYDEDLTLEGRARYYDSAGALRDMIQSHLLEVMAILAMDAPATLGERDLRDRISSVLRAADVDPDFASSTRRARYTSGKIGRRKVPDYVDEPGVDPDRGTETLAEIEVSINNWRWAGVPFILRSGKSVRQTKKEAIITFRPVPHLPTGFTGQDDPTRLRIGFGPDTLQLEIDVNGPGDVFGLDRVALQAKLNDTDLLPYGEVLEGVIAGDPLLSVRGDTAEVCWRIVEPVLKAWKANKVPLEEYPAGSTGPSGWQTSRVDKDLG